jgi:hypothetical protein
MLRCCTQSNGVLERGGRKTPGCSYARHSMQHMHTHAHTHSHTCSDAAHSPTKCWRRGAGRPPAAATLVTACNTRTRTRTHIVTHAQMLHTVQQGVGEGGQEDPQLQLHSSQHAHTTQRQHRPSSAQELQAVWQCARKGVQETPQCNWWSSQHWRPWGTQHAHTTQAGNTRDCSGLLAFWQRPAQGCRKHPVRSTCPHSNRCAPQTQAPTARTRTHLATPLRNRTQSRGPAERSVEEEVVFW